MLKCLLFTALCAANVRFFLKTRTKYSSISSIFMLFYAETACFDNLSFLFSTIVLYPDRMEIVNPGLFPIGVTPDNILQKRVKRNEQLARLCFALHIMEGEGSGYDLMYETLLTSGKPKPMPYEGDDFVKVTINRKIGS